MLKFLFDKYVVEAFWVYFWNFVGISFHSDADLFAVLTYLVIFRLTELKLSNLKKLISDDIVYKVHRLVFNYVMCLKVSGNLFGHYTYNKFAKINLSLHNTHMRKLVVLSNLSLLNIKAMCILFFKFRFLKFFLQESNLSSWIKHEWLQLYDSKFVMEEMMQPLAL